MLAKLMWLVCCLPTGHSQVLHETRHGSMSAAKWTVDSPDGSVELDGHKFGSGDDGGPMLCNLVSSIISVLDKQFLIVSS